MGDCEICGSGGSRTQSVNYVGSTVDACRRCSDKLGLRTRSIPRSVSTVPASLKSGGYGGGGSTGKDIMQRGKKELRTDYASAIESARESKGWSKKELALMLGVRLNIVQRVESGSRPDDDLVKRLEKVLGLKLMQEAAPVEERMTSKKNSSGMTLGDFFDN